MGEAEMEEETRPRPTLRIHMRNKHNKKVSVLLDFGSCISIWGSDAVKQDLATGQSLIRPDQPGIFGGARAGSKIESNYYGKVYMNFDNSEKWPARAAADPVSNSKNSISDADGSLPPFWVRASDDVAPETRIIGCYHLHRWGVIPLLRDGTTIFSQLKVQCPIISYDSKFSSPTKGSGSVFAVAKGFTTIRPNSVAMISTDIVEQGELSQQDLLIAVGDEL